MTAPVQPHAVNDLHDMGSLVATRLPAYVHGDGPWLVAGKQAVVPRAQAEIGFF